MKLEVSTQSQDQPPRTLRDCPCSAPVASPKGPGPKHGQLCPHPRPPRPRGSTPFLSEAPSPRSPPPGAPAQAVVIRTRQFRRAPPTLFPKPPDPPPPPPKRAQVQ